MEESMFSYFVDGNIKPMIIEKTNKQVETEYKNTKGLLDLINKLIVIEKLKESKKTINNQVMQILLSNKELLTNKIFINYYYWMTNLSLNNLLKCDCYDYSSNAKLLKYLNPIIKDNFSIRKMCNNCNNYFDYTFPNNRANKNEIIKSNQTWICKKCIIKENKESEIKKVLKIQEDKTREIECKNILTQFKNKSSNLIITSYRGEFYVDISENEVTSLLSKEFIESVNKLLEIDIIDFKEFASKGDMALELLYTLDRDIINNSLFIFIYKYFTSLRLDNLDKIYGEDVIKLITDKFIIKIIDYPTNKVTYEYPLTRTSSRDTNYTDFRQYLFAKQSLDIFTNFKNIFIDNKFEKEIIDSKIENGDIIPLKIKTEIIGNIEGKDITINDLPKLTQTKIKTGFFTLEKAIEYTRIMQLRDMPYKDYLKSEHWKITRSKAVKKANFKCEVCNSKMELNVHHKTYENRGCEPPEDLIVLCHHCHAKFHDKLDEEDEKDSNKINVGNNNVSTNYLKDISKKALSKKIDELNGLFGFKLIKDVHIDFNDDIINKMVNEISEYI